MVHALARPLFSASSVSSFCSTSATSFLQPRPPARLAPLGLSATARGLITTAAATLVAQPVSKKGVQHRSKEAQRSRFSSSTEVKATEPEQKAAGSETTASTRTVRPDRRSSRRPRENQPKDASSSTDLRCVHGVGPKNEQLLVKIGLSSVASLKEVFKVEHKESKMAMQRYLQVSMLIKETVSAPCI